MASKQLLFSNYGLNSSNVRLCVHLHAKTNAGLSLCGPNNVAWAQQ